MLEMAGDTLSHTNGSLSMPRTEILPGTEIPAAFAASTTAIAPTSFAVRTAAG